MSTAHSTTRGVTLDTLGRLKKDGEKFCCVAAYDATFARLIGEAGVETMIVGDSLGMVLQGHDSTLPVTVDDMAYHTRCVARGNRGALLIADLPFMSYGTTEQALAAGATLMRAGAHVVKLEGGAWLEGSIRALVERGVPVCGHLGLTPQSVNLLGGFRVQGRGPEGAKDLLANAKAVAAAGASLLVLECVPAKLAADITKQLPIPVIGIGAGPGTDAQVLVLHDLLGLNPRAPRFVRNFMQGQPSIQAALGAYVEAVKTGAFPAPEHCYE